MSDYRMQAHLDAPLDEVWALVGNPATYPQWWPAAVEIRGEKFEVGDVYTQVLATFAGRRLEYTRVIDRRDELKELRWSCPTTGGFQNWLVTAAQGGTFVDMEMGLHPPALRYRLFDRSVGRWFMKRGPSRPSTGCVRHWPRPELVRSRRERRESRLLRQRADLERPGGGLESRSPPPP